MTKPGCCVTCKWAEFVYTPTGRISRAAPGRCTFPIPEKPMLPACVNTLWPTERTKHGIWFDGPMGCAAHEEEPKEKADG